MGPPPRREGAAVVRVTILDTLGEHGGMNYYTHGLAAAMADAGPDVTVQAPPDAMHRGQRYRWREAFTGAYGADAKLRRALRLVRSSVGAALHDWRAKSDWVVFHIFRADLRELLDIVLAKASGRRIACIVHDISRTDRTVTRNHMARIVALSDRIVVHNTHSRELLCAGVPAATCKTAVIAHGAFVGQFAQPSIAESRAKLGLPAGGTVLLFFGNQRREKGLDLLLRALEPFRERTDLTLVVAGKAKPDEEAFYRRTAEEAGVGGLVRFAFGHVPDALLPQYYRAASVVVLPYRRIYESGVALMAMSFGRAVIASDIPVFAALAAECDGVATFPTDDASALSRRVGELLDGTLDAAAMGERARDFAEHERSWRRSGEAWAALLASAGTAA